MNYTARQAYNMSTQTVTNFEAVYSHICFQCIESIQRFSEFHFSHCTFEIPTYIIGYAVYDSNIVRRRLKKHLRSLEYKVKTCKLNPRIIYISWSHISKYVLNKNYINK